MKITVLGTGMVGRIIADKLKSLGHEVVLGTRNPKSTLTREEGDAYGNPPFKDWYKDHQDIAVQAFAEATAGGELIFNCTSGQATIAALEAAGAENFKGKVLIDLANPLDFSQGMPPSLNPTNTDSLGELIQRTFPEAKVVKTLNTMNAQIMVDPAKISGRHSVFISGNDEAAKQVTKNILGEFGWPEQDIIDLGDITTARGSEMLLPIWLRLWGALGTAEFNFHIQKND
ncbi:MAG: NAD(P)-binding domain-containing protein [Bacteroidota bacterium]